MLQLISIILVIYSYFLIQTSIPKLPRLIPTHYTAAGVADGWGPPGTLWVLLAAQVLTCAVFLLVPYIGRRFPGSVHFGSRRLSDFPSEQRQRLMPILNELGGCLGVVMSVFFVYMLRQVVEQATEPVPHLYMFWPLALLLGGTVGVLLFYWVKFNQATKE